MGESNASPETGSDRGGDLALTGNGEVACKAGRLSTDKKVLRDEPSLREKIALD